MAFDFLKKRKAEEKSENEFIEIDLEQEKSNDKIYVKTFALKVYEDINPILDCLRTGYNIAVIDISPLKGKDVIELKRAISKIKKTVDALEGKIAGFGQNCVIATPSKVFDVQKGVSENKEKPKTDIEYF